MKTTRVGTRGFQAPELLCGKNYSKKCDTFSLGVTLFVLMSKTMPCREEATVQDPLYVYMAAKKYKDYWDKFARGGINFSPNLKILLQGMLAYQPVERMNINDTTKDGVTLTGIKSSAWFNEEVYSQEELVGVLRDKFLVARNQRNKVRNPETEINSVSFRSGTLVELPPLPARRENWAIPLDKAEIQGPEGKQIQLHPDHVFQALIHQFEIEEEKRCKSIYNEEEGYLELTSKVEYPAEEDRAPDTIKVQIQGYQRDGEYFLDIEPTEGYYVKACKKLTDDIQKFLSVYS